jgi:TonB family protein
MCSLLGGLLIFPVVAIAQDASASAGTRPTEPAYFEFQVTTTVRPLRGTPPAYPPELREAHIDGRVLVQFVVDASGTPEMRTFKVLMCSNALFSAAVREAVASMRFEPARLDGRSVRQVVQQPFTFAMQ